MLQILQKYGGPGHSEHLENPLNFRKAQKSINQVKRNILKNNENQEKPRNLWIGENLDFLENLEITENHRIPINPKKSKKSENVGNARIPEICRI